MLIKCESACNLLEKYKISNQNNTHWMDELDSKLKDLEEYETKGSTENREVVTNYDVSVPSY